MPSCVRITFVVFHFLPFHGVDIFLHQLVFQVLHKQKHVQDDEATRFGHAEWVCDFLSLAQRSLVLHRYPRSALRCRWALTPPWQWRRTLSWCVAGTQWQTASVLNGQKSQLSWRGHFHQSFIFWVRKTCRFFVVVRSLASFVYPTSMFLGGVRENLWWSESEMRSRVTRARPRRDEWKHFQCVSSYWGCCV